MLAEIAFQASWHSICAVTIFKHKTGVFGNWLIVLNIRNRNFKLFTTQIPYRSDALRPVGMLFMYEIQCDDRNKFDKRGAGKLDFRTQCSILSIADTVSCERAKWDVRA